MGTRGAMTFVVDGTEKTVYNHWDSYPTGLGQDLLDWLRDEYAYGAGADDIAPKLRALAPVPDREPTAEERERYAPFTDPDVDSGEGWYSVLRHTQGKPNKLIEAGLYEPAEEFPRDSLFCEWAYVVDADARTFEVYQGFQQRPPTEGRWVGQARTEARYYPVQRIASFGWHELPGKLEDVLSLEE